MRIRPTIPGAVIRDPITRLALPDDGGDVPDNQFWRRRLLAREVQIVDDQIQPLVTR
jgi:hypothetical protein